MRLRGYVSLKSLCVFFAVACHAFVLEEVNYDLRRKVTKRQVGKIRKGEPETHNDQFQEPSSISIQSQMFQRTWYCEHLSIWIFTDRNYHPRPLVRGSLRLAKMRSGPSWLELACDRQTSAPKQNVARTLSSWQPRLRALMTSKRNTAQWLTEQTNITRCFPQAHSNDVGLCSLCPPRRWSDAGVGICMLRGISLLSVI